ncbi:MAG: hypothetical protein K2W80_17340 [Burkholderiales bacterium]|nr:hypothetical protein [Burkholderiales bacterium]
MRAHDRTVRAMAGALALSILLPSPPLQAARPYATDDARITPAGGCQVESWVQHHRPRGGGTEFWALPACNPGGNLEISAGLNRLPSEGGQPWNGNALVQVKTLLRSLDTGIGTGFAAGATARVSGSSAASGPSALASAYAYNVTSIAFADEAFVLLTLAGIKRDRETQRTIALWGVGSETRLFRRGDQELLLAAEVYGSDRGSPSWQGGFRFWVVKEKVQVDAVIGRQVGSREIDRSWWSIGVRLIGDGLLR